MADLQHTATEVVGYSIMAVGIYLATETAYALMLVGFGVLQASYKYTGDSNE